MISLDQVFRINGATMTDEVFSLDPRICGEQLHWNITRIWEDVERGKFAKHRRWFKNQEPMSAMEAANIDWIKVDAIMRNPRALQRPALAVDMDGMTIDGKPITNRHIVDGNHTVSAREKYGLEFYDMWVVPSDIEAQYRVTFRDGRGKPITLEI